MEKRYQVFISSTFADLEQERKGVMEAIIALNCFPAGMEMFPASDSEQFEYIKAIIDQSDYYVLVIAGRYGSVAEDKISFTEKEYDYAKLKGIPILTFVKRDINTLTVNKTDEDPDKKEKLIKFREKALEGRLAKLWNSGDDLKYLLLYSLSNEFKIHPRRGWMQGDFENSEILLRQINELRIENDNLKEEKLKSKNKNDSEIYIETLAQGESEFEVNFILKYYSDYINDYKLVEDVVKFTWDELFDKVGYKLLTSEEGKSFEDIITLIVSGSVIENKGLTDNTDLIEVFRVHEKDIVIIKMQLINLGLIKEYVRDRCVLTDKGKHIIIDKLLIKNK